MLGPSLIGLGPIGHKLMLGPGPISHKLLDKKEIGNLLGFATFSQLTP